MAFQNSQTIYGLKTKTINIATEAGSVKFRLQQNNELGLPLEATIVGIQARTNKDTITSSTGLKLVKQTVFENAYLTLKDRECQNGGKIAQLASQYYLPNLVSETLFLQPVQSANIDWNESFIQINPRALADVENLRVFELVIYYLDSCNNSYQNRLNFSNASAKAGIRQAYFEISLNSIQQKYSLSNSPNVGLPQDALILGFSTVTNNNPLYGTTAQSAASLDSTYFTLKKGTWSFVEEYPAAINNYKNTLFSSTNYFPISPMINGEIDWQQSNIIINDLATVTNDMVFQFNLIYYTV